MFKIAVFPGSFSPFTIGHNSIIEKALPIFDKIIIAIGENAIKKQIFSIEQRIQWIESVYKNHEKIEIKNYEGLTFIPFVLSSSKSSPVSYISLIISHPPINSSLTYN